MKKNRAQSETVNLVKTFFRFIIPSILSMLTFSIYTIVDGIFVAKGVGEKALAAVNLSSPYNACMFACGLLIAVGMATVIAMELGKGQTDRASRLFTQNLFMSAAVSLIITATTLLNLKRIALFLGATPDTLVYVMEYVGVIAPFAVFFICAYNMEVLVKTDGTPIISLVGVGAAGGINIVLDWLFVMVFKWGVKGAAFATGLAQVASVILYIIYFTKYSKVLHFTRFRWDFRIYRRTLPLGIGDGITEFSNGLVIFLFNQAILKLLGEDGIVCYTVVGYVNTLVLMMMSGTAQGLQPICSFHYGRQEWDHCETLRRLGMGVAIVFGAVGWALCTFMGESIVALFLQDTSPLFLTSVAALGKYSWAFLVMGVNVVTAAFFTSIGKAPASALISIGRGLVFPVLAVMTVLFINGGDIIWYAGVIAEGTSLVMTLVFLLGRRAAY